MAGTVTCPLKQWKPVDMQLCAKCPHRTEGLPSSLYCLAMIRVPRKKEGRGRKN